MAEYFKRCNNAFVFEFERQQMKTGEEIVLVAPRPVPNARSVNDICYIKSTDVEIYGTISRNPDDAIWVKIDDGQDINKCVNYIRVVSLSDGQYISFRVSMN